jgi:hypothetical protein
MPAPLPTGRPMHFLEDESAATPTECGLIAAGVGFAVSLIAMPPGLTPPRSIAALMLLLALGAAEWWLSRRPEISALAHLLAASA